MTRGDDTLLLTRALPPTREPNAGARAARREGKRRAVFRVAAFAALYAGCAAVWVSVFLAVSALLGARP